MIKTEKTTDKQPDPAVKERKEQGQDGVPANIPYSELPEDQKGLPPEVVAAANEGREGLERKNAAFLKDAPKPKDGMVRVKVTSGSVTVGKQGDKNRGSRTLQTGEIADVSEEDFRSLPGRFEKV
jgi:hypothetical protein